MSLPINEPVNQLRHNRYVKLNSTPSININFCCLMVSSQTIHLFTCRTSSPSTMSVLPPLPRPPPLRGVLPSLLCPPPLYCLLPPLAGKGVWHLAHHPELDVTLTTEGGVTLFMNTSIRVGQGSHTSTHTKNRLKSSCV